MKTTFLSVIIPVYNEEERLAPTIKSIADFLNQQDFLSEIIIVNDGSTDATSAVVKNFLNQCMLAKCAIRLIDNKVNRGKGAVIKQGMLAAEGEWRLFADADNSTPISEVDKLLLAAKEKNAEIVIGSRWRDKNSQLRKQPLKRIIVSRLGNLLIQLLFLPGIRDTQCGFKLFSAHAAARIFPKQSIEGWRFDIEILFLAKKMGYRIVEVPVSWRHTKGSKVGAMRKEIQRSLLDILRILLNILKGKYPK